GPRRLGVAPMLNNLGEIVEIVERLHHPTPLTPYLEQYVPIALDSQALLQGLTFEPIESKETPMKVLHIDSSILGDNSASRVLSREMVSKLQSEHPEAVG